MIKKVALMPSSKWLPPGEPEKILAYLEERGIQVMFPAGRGEIFHRGGNDASTGEIRSSVDLMISLGGDGTLLHACKIIAGTDIPVLGINLGHLGFLTESGGSEWENALEKTLKGEHQIQERMMVECSVVRDGQVVFSGPALNDVVIHHGGEMLLLKLSLKISGNFAGSYSADGVVVSTPTGSTAYSLSAGGPIVNPRVECMIITAISPHTLSARPLVIPPDEEVELCEISGKSYMVCLDGHSIFKTAGGDTVQVQKCPRYARFVHVGKRFYGTIREKLKWFE
jgi:NAD+ kinase